MIRPLPEELIDRVLSNLGRFSLLHVSAASNCYACAESFRLAGVWTQELLHICDIPNESPTTEIEEISAEELEYRISLLTDDIESAQQSVEPPLPLPPTQLDLTPTQEFYNSQL